jgi:hypothetical protein
VIYDGEGSGPEGLLRYEDELLVRCEDDETEAKTAIDAAAAAAWLAQQPGVRASTTKFSEALGVDRKTILKQRLALGRQGVAWTGDEELRAGGTRWWWLGGPAYASQRASWEASS